MRRKTRRVPQQPSPLAPQQVPAAFAAVEESDAYHSKMLIVPGLLFLF
jgi:hypothetical protein